VCLVVHLASEVSPCRDHHHHEADPGGAGHHLRSGTRNTFVELAAITISLTCTGGMRHARCKQHSLNGLDPVAQRIEKIRNTKHCTILRVPFRNEE